MTGHQAEGPLPPKRPFLSKRVLANRSLCEYPKNCLVNRLWVPIAVWVARTFPVGYIWAAKDTGLQWTEFVGLCRKQVEGEN